MLYQHALPRTLTLKRHTSAGVWKNKHSVYPDRSYVVESTMYRQGKIIVQIHWLVYAGKTHPVSLKAQQSIRYDRKWKANMSVEGC